MRAWKSVTYVEAKFGWRIRESNLDMTVDT